MLRKYKYKKGSKVRKAKQVGRLAVEEEGALLVPPEQTPIPPLAEDVPIDAYPNISPDEEEALEASQVPDEQMEEDYLEFIVEQSLDDEEKTYLMSKLEADPQLSQIFDKVVGIASEFSGEGEVKGPGTEVSDSIPARLSEGEFVFTNKATEQIGAGELQNIMDEAERAYDGGLMSKVLGGKVQTREKEDEDLSGTLLSRVNEEEEIKKTMISSNRMPSIR